MSLTPMLMKILETDKEKEKREKLEQIEKEKANNAALYCLVIGCKNVHLPFSKYCSECYDEKYPPIHEVSL